MASDVRIVAWDRLDAAMEENLLVTAGKARKVVQSMISTSGGGGGGGGGGTTVVGASPIKVTPLGDGTALLEIVAAGAAVVENADGTITLTLGEG